MRRFLLSGFALAAMFGAAAGLLRRGPDHAGIGALACPILQPHLATADRVEISQGETVLWLERRGAVWGLSRQGGYPARSDAVGALFDRLGSVRFVARAEHSAGEPTTVRVLAQSGAGLCALDLFPGDAIVRRVGERQLWQASAAIPATADPAAWSQTTLPPLDPTEITEISGIGNVPAAPIAQALARLPIADIRARPQVRAEPVRSIGLTLRNGSARLTVGVQDGQTWLTVDGTAPWAQALAPYAFALPPDSVLVMM